MRIPTLTLVLSTYLTALSLGLAAQAAPAAGAAQKPDELPDGPGKDVAMKVCSACHPPTSITERMRTQKEWSTTIDNMASYGATATEAEFDEVLKYAVSVAGKANVNTAPAAELAPVLDVSPEVAAAVEKYRSEHGTFTSIDDVKKVPGVDAQKLEARKNRLEY
jgi:competence protein ComEA